MPVKYVTCTCVELGCSLRTHLDLGLLKQGYRMSASAYNKHQRKIQEHLRLKTSTEGSQPLATGSQANIETPEQTQRINPCDISAADPTQGPPDPLLEERMPSFNFCEPNALIVMLQAAELFLLEGLGEEAVNRFLKMEIEKWRLHIPDISKTLTQQIPKSIETVLFRLGLSPSIVHATCCPSCFSIYPPTIRPTYYAIQKKKPLRDVPSTTHCSSKFYSTSKLYVKSLVGPSPTCGAALFKNPEEKGGYPYTPVRTFSYRTLADWIRSKICLPNFEDLLDSPLSHHKASETNRMADVWDGKIWKTFQDPTDSSRTYTSTSGNLVFSLFVDWFNPFRGKHQSPVSVGVIVLVCLNLPPSARYREENLFLFGIIPGPVEPSLSQMNSLLGPLVDELKNFWKGIWFNRSFRNPGGRLFKAVIFPLIADLPALRKTAGFTSHNSKNFCSHCLLTTENINIIDPSKFEPRSHESHLAQSFKWLNASTDSERTKIAEEEGVRYSVLNDLPYWRPTEYCGIELMHSIILGNLKDHAQTFLDIRESGVTLKKSCEDRKKRQLPARYRHPFDILGLSVAGENTGGKRKRTEDLDSPPPPPPQTKPPQSKQAPQQEITTNDQTKKTIGSISPETSHRRKRSRISSSHTHDYNLRKTSSDQKRTNDGASSRAEGKKRKIDDTVCDAENSTEMRNKKALNEKLLKRDHAEVIGKLEQITSSSSYYLRSSSNSSQAEQNAAANPTGRETRDHTVPDLNSLKRRQLGSSDISSRNSSTEPSTSQFDERSDKSKPSASNSDADTHTPNSDAETIGSTGTVKANTKTKRAQKQELKEKLKALSKLDPKILPSELEAVHRCIQLTRVPSWMTRVKSVVGFPGSNSLKAAEWLVLYSVYFSLTLIPIWKASSGNPNREALLNSTVELINLTNFLTSRTVDPDDLDWFSKTMINYRTVLAEGWKGQATCKPNLHISQHYPEHITRFGPPASTASWAHERLNGTLGKISTNNRTENLHKTILERWNIKSQLISLVENSVGLLKKLPSSLLMSMKSFKTQAGASKGKTKKENLNLPVFNQWLSVIRHGPASTELNGEVSEQVQSHASTMIKRKTYSVQRKHKELEDDDIGKDPYKTFPRLNCKLVYSSLVSSIVIEDNMVVSHAALLTNPPGTFGIFRETCSVEISDNEATK